MKVNDPTMQLLLIQINKIREVLGLGPPLDDIANGRPNSVGSCPIAMSLQNGWKVRVDGHSLKFRKQMSMEGRPPFEQWQLALRSAGVFVESFGPMLNDWVLILTCTSQMKMFINAFDNGGLVQYMPAGGTSFFNPQDSDMQGGQWL